MFPALRTRGKSYDVDAGLYWSAPEEHLYTGYESLYQHSSPLIWPHGQNWRSTAQRSSKNRRTRRILAPKEGADRRRRVMRALGACARRVLPQVTERHIWRDQRNDHFCSSVSMGGFGGRQGGVHTRARPLSGAQRPRPCSRAARFRVHLM